MGTIIDDLMNIWYHRFINLQITEMDACDFGLIYIGLFAILRILESVISRILWLFGMSSESSENGRFTSKAWSIVAIMITGTIGMMSWMVYEFNFPCSVIWYIGSQYWIWYASTSFHNICIDLFDFTLSDYSRYLVHGALVTELSSPVLSLIHLSFGTTKLIFMMVFVMVFFLTRIVFLAHVWYRYYESYTQTIGDTLCIRLIGTLYVLNWYRFVFILKKSTEL